MPFLQPVTALDLTLALALVVAAASPSPGQAAGELDIGVGAARFRVEIADSEQERRQGLMFRTQLPEDGGMLFIQPTAGPATFWMKNTYIPLDLLYFDSAGRLLEIHAETPPCTTLSCPTYSSNGAVKYILELNAGSARRLNLQPGARLQFGNPP